MSELIDNSCNEAYRQGWLEAASWADRDDLIADIDSPAYAKLRDFRIRSIKASLRILTEQPSPAEPDKEAVRNAALEEAAKVCDYHFGLPECPQRAQLCAEDIRALKSQPAPATTQSGVLMVQENDTISYNHPEYGPGIFFTEDCVIDQPALASDSKATDAAEILGNAIYDAAKKCGIANNDHNSLSTSQLLHLLDCMVSPPSDSRTEFSDTEMLDWITENRAIVDYYGNGYRVCFIDDGSFYPEVYPTIQEAIKAAMKADREG